VFQRLLVAIDDSAANPVTVSFAIAIARREAAAVQVLYVNQFVVGGRGHTLSSEAEADQLVSGAVAELTASGVEATGALRRATCFGVATRIAESAAEWSADAIVVGSKRRRKLRRLGGQGIREQVTKLSDLPVLTAPAPLRMTGRAQFPRTAATYPQGLVGPAS